MSGRESRATLSVIIPVFNMADGTRRTLESLSRNSRLNELEVIVVDGGSDDGIEDVIESYSTIVSTFISEKDDGQYDAILKGMGLASGDIVTWLNADDTFYPWTIPVVLDTFSEFNDIRWISGKSSFSFADNEWIHIATSTLVRPTKYIARGYYRNGIFGFLQQESMFFKRDLWEESGGLELKYKLAADYKLWINFARRARLVCLDVPLAAFRITSESRSKLHWTQYEAEVNQIYKDVARFGGVIGLLARCNLGKFLRIFLWSSGDYIFYSLVRKTIVRKRGFRPLRSESISRIIAEGF